MDAYKERSNDTMVDVQDGHLVLSCPGNRSSVNVVLGKPSASGI